MTDTIPNPSRRLMIAGALAAGLAGCRASDGAVLPATALPGLPDLTVNGWPVPGISARQFVGRVSLLNVWASWCPYCRSEHEALMRLSSDDRFAMVGLVYRDAPEKAAAYLRRAGNPYRAVALDPGDYARALGQRGVPSTYVVDQRGVVVASVHGEVGADAVRDHLMPAVLRCRQTG